MRCRSKSFACLGMRSVDYIKFLLGRAAQCRLYVLHTGIQGDQLTTKRNELHDTNVYKWHNRWAKDGSYQMLFQASLIQLPHTDQLDTSVLHGDGSNTVVKKGASASAMLVISPRKVKKN